MTTTKLEAFFSFHYICFEYLVIVKIHPEQSFIFFQFYPNSSELPQKKVEKMKR